MYPLSSEFQLQYLTTDGKASQPPAEPPHDLVKDVVYNELQDRGRQSFWEYRIEKRIAQQSITEEQVETQYGSIYRVIAKNGVPLNQAQQQQEDSRLDDLLRNPSERENLKNNYDKDEQRLERLMALLPDAFVCEYDGEDGGNVRLTFRPNPLFKATTFEARIFHGVFQRRGRGAEQQSQSNHEKIIWLSYLPYPGTRALSLTWQTT